MHLYNDRELSPAADRPMFENRAGGRWRPPGPDVFLHQRVCDVLQPWQRSCLSGRQSALPGLHAAAETATGSAPPLSYPIKHRFTQDNTCAVRCAALCRLSRSSLRDHSLLSSSVGDWLIYPVAAKERGHLFKAAATSSQHSQATGYK